jgi:hypothetical protein
LSENSKLGDAYWAIVKVIERAVHPDHFQKLPCRDFQLNLPDTDERGDELILGLLLHPSYVPATACQALSCAWREKCLGCIFELYRKRLLALVDAELMVQKMSPTDSKDDYQTAYIQR